MKWYLQVLKKYAVFNGRARRSEFWYFVLFNIIIQIILSIVGLQLGIPSVENIYSLAVLLPSVAVGVRRMHDINKSGWFYLIPFYNLYLCCLDGTAGENRYGRDPKRPEFDEFLEQTAVQ